ncbi:hypothetical protein [Stappia sp.]|uniref:hypothetical protein n=1 Tax=Stappia sp. TaxID=1870903 RepID=UPI003C7ECFDC
MSTSNERPERPTGADHSAFEAAPAGTDRSAAPDDASHPADPSARESAPAAPPKTRDTREERLAAALRANLRKRKAAARPRSQ